MNTNLILIIALIIFAVAIFAFILVVLVPATYEEGLNVWIATDEDGSTFLYTSRPTRKDGYWDTTGMEHQPMIDIEDLKGLMELPTWKDEPREYIMKIIDKQVEQ